MTDYTRYALLEDLEELKMIQEHEIKQMIMESEYLQACYENNEFVPTMEASGDGLMADIVRATQVLFAKVTGYFRKSAINKFRKQFNEESIKRIKQNMKKVEENCVKLGTQKMTPYWDGDYIKDKGEIDRAMKAAFSNVQNQKTDDYNFAKSLVTDTELISTRDTDLRDYLLNRFRYGVNDMKYAESREFTGKEIATHIKEIIDYIEKFPTSIAALPGEVSDAYNKDVKFIKSIINDISKPVSKQEMDADTNGETKKEDSVSNTPENKTEKEPATDSVYVNVTPDTYLLLENRYVSESILPMFVGYPVTEGGEKALPAVITPRNNNSDQQPKGNETKTPTAVTPADDNKSSTGDSNTTGGNSEDEKDPSSGVKDYFKNVNSFFKLSLTCYQTTIEERFVVYAKILKLVASEFISVPQKQVEKATEEDNKQKKFFGLGGKKTRRKK